MFNSTDVSTKGLVNVVHPAKLFPSWNESNARIVEQLEYRLEAASELLVYSKGFGEVLPGKAEFLGCPVSSCRLTMSKSDQWQADAMIVSSPGSPGEIHRSRPDQVLIVYALESPAVNSIHRGKLIYNWTATYRRDSVLNTPYAYYAQSPLSTAAQAGVENGGQEGNVQVRNYAEGKDRLVAWFVSNCGTSSKRELYVNELSNHIQVDMYGHCGGKTCPRGDHKCDDLLDSHYKFYLAFENALCRDYITEKFFENGLGHDIVPVVRGAPKADYLQVAPPDSFIHVDDFETPQELADYLHTLDKNDTLYNEYFRWKGGGGRFLNTRFWCRLCGLLHASRDRSQHVPPMWYDDLAQWWEGEGTCVHQPSGDKPWPSWRDKNELEPRGRGARMRRG